jgi:hypothetical protein
MLTGWQPDPIFICSWGRGVGQQRSCWYINDVTLEMSYVSHVGWGVAITFIMMQRWCYARRQRSSLQAHTGTVDATWKLAKDMVPQHCRHWAEREITHCSWQMSNNGNGDKLCLTEMFAHFCSTKQANECTNTLLGWLNVPKHRF